MTDDKLDLKDEGADDLRQLEQFLSNETDILPNTSLDKQIIAAAHREVLAPKKPLLYRVNRWRKLSLPLYIAAGFSFTVVAFKSLWPVPIYFSEEGTSASISVKIEQEAATPESKIEQKERIKRQLPEFISPPITPESAKSEKIISDIEQNGEQSFDSELKKEEIYTGIHLSKATFPEKEAWARKIIDQMKNGDLENARLELVRFKKVYPNYPIEEQIKVLM